MRSKTRAVLCDAVGTLIYASPPVVETYLEFGRKFGSRLSRDEVALRFHQAFHAEERADAFATNTSTYRLSTSEAHERCRWQRIVQAVFVELPDSGGELFATLWNHFADSRNWQVFDDVADSLQSLKSLGVVLGIASNFDRRLVAITQRFESLAACDHIFCSSLLGHSKPSPEFFLAAEKALKLSPQEILLVGDDWENDFQAGTAAGWRAIHLDRSRTNSGDCLAHSLRHVVDIVERWLAVG